MLRVFCLALLLCSACQPGKGSDLANSNLNTAALPVVGTSTLQMLTPTLLELTLVTTKPADSAHMPEWDFVDDQSRFHAPSNSQFVVKAGQLQLTVEAVGFRRRALYAPLKKRDLRIGNSLFLKLAAAVPEGARIQVENPDGKLWGPARQFVTQADPLRCNPAIHVNQEGYMPQYSKKAMVGYYLGSLGELEVSAQSGFCIVEADSTNIVYKGVLVARPDKGYEGVPRPYQHVLEADFTPFAKPGHYRLWVTGLGTSLPFSVHDGIAADLARAFALGLYHQRCGISNALPFTRFTHDPCHVRPAEVPTLEFKAANAELAQMSADFSANPKHTAPQLKNVQASLYPFINTNAINVSGGHHDAGDYSKYTINSAHLIHVLTFAADAFAGVGELDNLGLPESGDGKSDLLQEAKWEADFLAKLQDVDGGFYFLVYPRDREYENDVSLISPDCGDPQIVFPKTTAVTASAVAALAQMSSSPRFKKQFPNEAAAYLAKAKKGWDFLQRSIARHGRNGAYQKITHYGDEFMHDDELAWAAAEMFLATGDSAYEKELIAHFDPRDPNTRRWTWWRLFESYGNAIRSYAFAARTGRLTANQLNPRFLEKCETEIIECARDHVQWAHDNAYGTSFPEPSKRFKNAGWYFSSDRAFDLATACQLNYPSLNDPRPRFQEALLSNLNYEAGCNPVNVCFITGIGWKRQHEIVQHYAQNQKRSLPPTGLDIGNIQEGFAYLDPYKKELGALSFPPDGDPKNPYPFYDRWGDSFNTTTEFVTVNLARSLGAAVSVMAQTALKTQPWKPSAATIEVVKAPAGGRFTARLFAPNLELSNARCVWETATTQPLILPANESFSFSAGQKPEWIEAEAWWPDGRRAFARYQTEEAQSITPKTR